ncbi:MAG: DUF4280 domain-containing protein [Deltaproteobacteria bacterium]|nr:MAG: DUF4280 domain-containing protein [Deltaproteobacteria bacterium]
MPLQVVNTAKIRCTMSAKPSQLIVPPTNRRTAGGQPAANVRDHRPVVNIAPFGPCMSPSFPPTASATAAAGGALTPMPCQPNTATPWAPGSATVTVADQPALRSTDTCQCAWGGTIAIIDPGQTLVSDV